MSMIGNYLWELLRQTVQAVGISLLHNWKVLLLSVFIAVGLKTYVNSDKLTAVLFRKKNISIIASVLFGAFTPLCACGTTAVIIGMLTTTLPWGPIMAFLTSSPLMSPDGFIFISGIIGLRFAVALTVASLVIGISSGLITNLIEKKTNYLKDQSRYLGKSQKSVCSCEREKQEITKEKSVCSCNTGKQEISKQEEVYQDADNGMSVEQTMLSEGLILQEREVLCCASADNTEGKSKGFLHKLKLRELAQTTYQLGIKQILFFYVIFIAIGFMINYFIPTSIIEVLFGAKTLYAVPLASLIGLPLYITTNSGVPIIQSLLESGASEGAMLAFIITGSATSAWVIAGLATFMKKRAIALYITFVLFGGIISGYVYDLVNMFLS